MQQQADPLERQFGASLPTQQEKTMPVTPYLFLDGRCEEALEFYKKNLGAKVEMLMRYKEAPAGQPCAPGHEDKIMHACITLNGTQVMMSDGHVNNNPEFKGFAL